MAWKMSLNLPSYCFRMVFLVLRYSGQFLASAYWKQLWAKPSIDCKTEQRYAISQRSWLGWLVAGTYLIGVVHAHDDARGLEVIHLVHLLGAAVSRSEHEVVGAGLGHHQISGLVL
jgi:hypothetical protein